MRIAVTGSEGFIGRELRRVCVAQGISMLGLDTVPSAEPDHVVIDVQDPGLGRSLPEGLDAVVHLAAVSRDADCAADPRRAVEVNVAGALNVHGAARARSARQMIFASSEWVYGEVDGSEAQTEDMAIDVRRIRSEYALTKLFAEQLLRVAHARDPRTAVTVLRFGIVYGPRPANWSAVEQLHDAVRAGAPISVRSLKTARRFIHVSDLARGILSAVGRTGHEVFNLSGERLITLAEIIAASAEELGRRPSVSESDPAAVSVRNPDDRRAREALGWRPAIDLRAGLRSLSTG